MKGARYKCPTPRRFQLGTRSVAIGPLSLVQFDEAEQLAIAHFEGSDIPAQGVHFVIELQVRFIAAATEIRAEEIRRLYACQIDRLFAAWEQVQSDSTPDMDALSSAMRKGVITDPHLTNDGAAAFHSSGPAEYYGKPASQLTVGQLAYYLYLRSAFEEMYVEGETKKVSRKWLDEM